MDWNFLLAVLTTAVLIHTGRGQQQFTCRDQNNQPVDWFALYKLPRDSHSGNAAIAQGTAFLYLDVNNKNWQQSQATMNDSNQAVAYTLQQFYNRQADQSVMQIFYNDEHPDGRVSESKGHTKGVTYFDQTSGVWIVHSIPKFPQNTSYSYPSNALYYGQSMLCLSLGYNQLQNVATQLYFNTPYIYSSQLPLNIARAVPILSQVVAGQHPRSAPFTSVKTLTTLAGAMFTSFAKAGGFNQDLYHDLVATTLHVSLNTETWQHGADLYSDCSGAYQVHNIRDIQLPYGIAFSDYSDHSKVAIANVSSTSLSAQYVCIGDINRQPHQMVRGGGTVCRLDPMLWRTYNAMIKEVWPCRTEIADKYYKYSVDYSSFDDDRDVE